MAKGWIGVDLDGTLARYTTWNGFADIGEPIPKMANRVKQWLNDGKTVKIFTARVSSRHNNKDAETARKAISEWTKKHFGKPLEATSEKDSFIDEIWDDKAFGVVKNTGELK